MLKICQKFKIVKKLLKIVKIVKKLLKIVKNSKKLEIINLYIWFELIKNTDSKYFNFILMLQLCFNNFIMGYKKHKKCVCVEIFFVNFEK